MVVLNEDLVKSKTKVDNLLDVKNLNVCGQGIDDISILQETPNIGVLSLSVNKISSLRHFAFCTQLQQLYLRANAVSDLAEIRYLMSLPQLRVLWLADSPCSKLPHYRAFVVANLPQLENLDNLSVCEADRAAAKNMRTLQPCTAADVLAMELEAAARQAEQQQQERRQAEEQGSSTPPHSSPRQHCTTIATAPSLTAGLASGGLSPPAARPQSPEPAIIHHHHQQQQQQRQRQQQRQQQQADDHGMMQRHPQHHHEQRRRSVTPREAGRASRASCTGIMNVPSVAGCDAADLPLAATPAAGRVAASSSSRTNVLYAVMALLGELDASGLSIVQREVQFRLAEQQCDAQ